MRSSSKGLLHPRVGHFTLEWAIIKIAESKFKLASRYYFGFYMTRSIGGMFYIKRHCILGSRLCAAAVPAGAFGAVGLCAVLFGRKPAKGGCNHGQSRAVAGGMAIDGLPHGPHMIGRCPATPTDNTGPAVHGKAGIVCHQRRRAVVVGYGHPRTSECPRCPWQSPANRGWQPSGPVRCAEGQRPRRHNSPRMQGVCGPAPPPDLSYPWSSPPSWCGRRCQSSWCHTQGISARAQASAAALNSSGAEIVSTHAISAPPAFSPSICSWKISTAAA